VKETQRIADQVKRAFYGEAWSGPCVNEVLENVTAEIAVMRVVPDAHSIWELVHHIEAWLNIVRRRVNGEVFTVTPEVNFPPVHDSSETTWKKSQDSLERSEQELRAAILALPETRLDEPAVPGGDSVYVLLHGAVQHSLYHAGQIALLKKAHRGG
jgi:predicted RNase H-like nuclease